MQRAHELIELCKKRDRLKRESLFLDMLIFDQKQKVRAWVGAHTLITLHQWEADQAFAIAGRVLLVQVWEIKRRYKAAHPEALAALDQRLGKGSMSAAAAVSSANAAVATPLRIKLVKAGEEGYGAGCVRVHMLWTRAHMRTHAA